ncbi:hypothetical protein L209DRAFT_719830 [Thermothelomyces heterothallicus CBS 203.75]
MLTPWHRLGPSKFVVVGTSAQQQGRYLAAYRRYDEVTDISMDPWFKHIPRVRWVTLENSSPMAHWEDRERFMDVTGTFLSTP